MKRALAVLVTALLVSAAGFQFVETGLANPYAHYPYDLPFLTITSPANQSSNFGDVSLTTRTYAYRYNHIDDGYIRFETVQWLNFRLDGGTPQSLNWEPPDDCYTEGKDVAFTTAHVTSASINLVGLSNGSHVISVRGETTFHNSLSSTVSFEVVSDASATVSPGDSASWDNPAPFPTASVVAILTTLAVAAAVGLGLLVHLLKRT